VRFCGIALNNRIPKGLRRKNMKKLNTRKVLKSLAIALVIIPCSIIMTACGGSLFKKNTTAAGKSLALDDKIVLTQDCIQKEITVNTSNIKAIADMTNLEKANITMSFQLNVNGKKKNINATTLTMGSTVYMYCDCIKVNNEKYSVFVQGYFTTESENEFVFIVAAIVFPISWLDEDIERNEFKVTIDDIVLKGLPE
jgi:hypothetical protein